MRFLKKLCQFRSPRITLSLTGLLLAHTGLLAYAATRHSPTFNETAHLPAGLSHWQFGRFELYRVNPPLVRMVAAFPVLAADPQTDWSKFQDTTGSRPVFAIGEDFVAANGKRSIWLYTIARWACIPFSLLGGYICFRWSRDIWGGQAGLLAAALWCFSPNILAHAELITPDAAAAGLGVFAAYLFWRWLKEPAWPGAVSAGLLLGLAELTKFTWIVLFVLWPLMWVLYKFSSQSARGTVASFLRELAQLGIILLMGLYVLNLGYGFEGSFTRLRDYHFVSKSFKGPDADSTGATNRHADSWIGRIPIPVPKNYFGWNRRPDAGF